MEQTHAVTSRTFIILHFRYEFSDDRKPFKQCTCSYSTTSGFCSVAGIFLRRCIDNGKVTPEVQMEDRPGNLKVAQQNWDKWEQEVESGQELAQARIAALQLHCSVARLQLPGNLHYV